MKCRLVPIASSFTSTFVGSVEAAAGAALGATVTAGAGGVTEGAPVGAALGAGPLLVCAPSQPAASIRLSVRKHLKPASFRLFRLRSRMPGMLYHPRSLEGSRR